jgi:hypothetical protein
LSRRRLSARVGAQTPRRFADAGSAEHGKMLAQHFIDVEAGRDRRVLLKLPDLDRA